MMIDPKSVSPLTDFNRNTKVFLNRLRKSGQPEMLTINGKAAIVIQDAAAYSAMIERLDHAYLVESIRVGLEQADAGKVRPLKAVAKELRARIAAKRRRPA